MQFVARSGIRMLENARPAMPIPAAKLKTNLAFPIHLPR
jgi:hypothetical protein